MAFEYGSTDLGIRNPFRIESCIRAARGLLVCGLGLYSLLAGKGLVEAGGRLEGWLTLGVGVLLLGNGISTLGYGLFQVMRFFVGLGVPASLAKNIAKSEAPSMKPGWPTMTRSWSRWSRDEKT